MPDGLTPPRSEATSIAAPAAPATPTTAPPGAGSSAPATRRWTLTRRLVAAYAALALLVAAAVGAFIWSGSRLVAEQGEARAMGEVARVADRLAAVLERAEETGAVLSTTLPPDAAGCDAALEAAALGRPTLSGRITLVDPERRIVCASARDRAAMVAEFLPILLTAERTSRPIGATLVLPRSGEPVLMLAHPVRRGTQDLGTLLTEMSVAHLRSRLGDWNDSPDGGLWLLDPNGGSAALRRATAPPAVDVDPLFGPDAGGAHPVSRRTPDGLLVATRLSDDLALLALVPPSIARPAPAFAILAAPLALAALLLVGLAALFWAVGHFVLAPLEAATQRLEAARTLAPDTREARAPAEIAEIIARLGAARATREEAVRLRDMLLREVNHRIKNHLALVASFLRLQERHLSDHAALQALRAAEGRMRAIALTYEVLHEGTGDCVALDRMLERTAKALTSRDAGGPAIETELEPAEVPADIAVKVGLLVNELATNSLKHAFVGRAPGTVRISLRRRGPGFVLRVSDDGAGTPEGTRRNLGMTVVENLSRAIGARLERLPGPGTGHEIAWLPAAQRGSS